MFRSELKITLWCHITRIKPTRFKPGVQWGPLFWLILFTMYTTPLGNIIRSHVLDCHLYADDTQIHTSFKPADSKSRQTVISKVEPCIKDVRSWKINDLLRLNYDREKLILITNSETINRQQNIPIGICAPPIVLNLGPHGNLSVLFNLSCSLNKHVNQLCHRWNPEISWQSHDRENDKVCRDTPSR